ncbi:hypothetical protein C9R18_26340, partial [Salmonella enterica subsp. enterica serovar Enteritidis]|nr:hypothetical protein [Salmonella enterica subsp. enterica serovar Enteritidis]
RITTSKDANRRRTDFFELYWADLTQGTSRGRLYAWMSSLLLRKPADIPADARRLYGATLLFAIVMALAALLLAFSFWKAWFPAGAVLLAIGASGLFWAFDHFVVPYFGDVATYVQAEAGTVEKRALVRERGLGLMRRLMDDPTYDRIILASHSLGSVIAYDLLQILWAERRPQNLLFQRDKSLWQAIRQVEKYAQLPDAPPQALTAQERADFRKAQWRLYEETRTLDARLGKGWKISDFVSVGSPLTHAEFLVTHNVAAWREGVAERRFSICPPIADTATHPLLYESGRDD